MSQTKKSEKKDICYNDFVVDQQSGVNHVVIYTEWEADTATTQDTRKTHTHAAATQRLCLNT